MKKLTSLFIGIGLLLLPLQVNASPNDFFWNKQEKEDSESDASEEEWDELWEEAQNEADKANEDNRTEEEKLSDFDQQWDAFGNDTLDNTSSSTSGIFSSETHHGFGSFNQLWNSILSSSGDNEGTGTRTNDDLISPEIPHSSRNSDSPSIKQELSSFEEKWDQFGQKFDSTYDGEGKNSNSFESEASFDETTGTYERSN